MSYIPTQKRENDVPQSNPSGYGYVISHLLWEGEVQNSRICTQHTTHNVVEGLYKSPVSSASPCEDPYKVTSGYGRRSACFCAPCIHAGGLLRRGVSHNFQLFFFRFSVVDMDAVSDR